MGADISQHATIETIFPETTSSFRLFDESGWDTALFEMVQGIIFPANKLMWPVAKEYDANKTVIHRRLKAVRSVKDVMYTVDKIYSLVFDERGAWVFVRHERQNDDESQLAGFLTTLDDAKIQEYGNVEPIDITVWIKKNGK
jgi:hypothetical protein